MPSLNAPRLSEAEVQETLAYYASCDRSPSFEVVRGENLQVVKACAELGVELQVAEWIGNVEDVDEAFALRSVELLEALSTPVLVEYVSAVLRRKVAAPFADRIADVFESKSRRNDDAGSAFLNLGWAVAYHQARYATDRLIRLVRLPNLSKSRGSIVLALGKRRNDRAIVIPVLMELIKDPDTTADAIGALGLLRAQEARELIVEHASVSEWTKAEARKALRRIDHERLNAATLGPPTREAQ